MALLREPLMRRRATLVQMDPLPKKINQCGEGRTSEGPPACPGPCSSYAAIRRRGRACQDSGGRASGLILTASAALPKGWNETQFLGGRD
jgi:hypothetical protein